MAYEPVEDTGGSIKIHVPDREISQITIDNLREYDEASRIAWTGVPRDITLTPKNRNDRTENRVAALRRMIGLQIHIISGKEMSTIKENCERSWNKKYRTEEEKKEHPFEKEENDIKVWRELLLELPEFEKMIDKSEMTLAYNDDFIWNKKDAQGDDRKVLTPNFYKMLKILVETYDVIYGALIRHKIVTLGVSEDIDKTEREKELEAMRRITDA